MANMLSLVGAGLIIIIAIAALVILSYHPASTSTTITTSSTTSIMTSPSTPQPNATVETLSTEITTGSPDKGCNALVKIYANDREGPSNDICGIYSVQLISVSGPSAHAPASASFNLYTYGVLINGTHKINLYGTSTFSVYGRTINIYLNATSQSQQSVQIVVNVSINTTAIPCSNCSGGPTSPLIVTALQNYLAPYCQGSSQAPVGQNGIPCSQEINSSAATFTNTSGAFDCAGFVKYVYSQEGINIPYTAQAQFGNFYPHDPKIVPVPGGQVGTVPGDLVYFSIPSDHDPEPAHVAMCYVAGCNTIIQNGGPFQACQEL